MSSAIGTYFTDRNKFTYPNDFFEHWNELFRLARVYCTQIMHQLRSLIILSNRLTHDLPSNSKAPFHHQACVLTHPYEPVQLISQEDICTESSLIGNPITSQPQQGQLLMRSERAFVERKDGRFVPLSDDTKVRSSTALHSWSIIGGVSRVTLAHVCNAVFNTLGLVASSLLAGVSAWHAVLIFTLASYANLDLNLVANLSKLSLPSHSLFCFLSSITVVYIADRIDVVRLDKQFIAEILKLRRIGTLFSIFALLLTSISLIITLSIMFLDLQIHYFSLPETNGWRFLWTDLIANSSVPPTNCPTSLYTHNSEFFSPISGQPISERVTAVKILVLIRAVLNLCGWIMVISSPTQNRWHSHLKELLAEESNSV